MRKLRRTLPFFAFLLSAGLLLNCSSAPEKAENGQSAAITAEPIKLTISKRGYEPKSIEVKRGQPVKLAIFREDEENCGEEIVFPKLNIKKTLPVGEIVPVEFTPSESGEINFTCGMDMLRGKVVVSD
jgi:plastocyanin domain-containing protein